MDSEELERVWALYARRVPRKTVERMYVIMRIPEPPRLPPPPPAALDAPTERLKSQSDTAPESDDS